MEKWENHEERISSLEKNQELVTGEIEIIKSSQANTEKEIQLIKSGQFQIENTLLKEFRDSHKLMREQKEALDDQTGMVSQLLPLVTNINTAKINAESTVKVAKIDRKTKVVIAVIAAFPIMNFVTDTLPIWKESISSWF